MHIDHREQLDLSTPHDLPGPDAPLYYNMRAPNQWPSPQDLPRFRPVFEEYMRAMSGISTFFTSLIAEAIGLRADAFDRFFDADQQHKLKVVKYPEVSPDVDDGDEIARQGVGPHKDSMLTSYLLQASPHRGLQALNAAGEWIDCPPKANTLVVAIGQGMEAITQGVCASTTHRVLSPRCGEGPRFSIPFFQGVSYDARFEEMDVPEAVRGLKRERRDDKVDFAFVKGRWGHLGEATLVNRVRSHPDVGEKWVSDLPSALTVVPIGDCRFPFPPPTAPCGLSHTHIRAVLVSRGQISRTWRRWCTGGERARKGQSAILTSPWSTYRRERR